MMLWTVSAWDVSHQCNQLLSPSDFTPAINTHGCHQFTHTKPLCFTHQQLKTTWVSTETTLWIVFAVLTPAINRQDPQFIPPQLKYFTHKQLKNYLGFNRDNVVNCIRLGCFTPGWILSNIFSTPSTSIFTPSVTDFIGVILTFEISVIRLESEVAGLFGRVEEWFKLLEDGVDPVTSTSIFSSSAAVLCFGLGEDSDSMVLFCSSVFGLWNQKGKSLLKSATKCFGKKLSSFAYIQRHTLMHPHIHTNTNGRTAIQPTSVEKSCHPKNTYIATLSCTLTYT